jgi:diketogulonate reductase-like aldo/keto reductase
MTAAEIPTVVLPSGERLPALGQTVRAPVNWDTGIDALRTGVDLGLTVIEVPDGDPGAEELVAVVLRDRREDVFLVAAVTPDEASRPGLERTFARRLHRLGTDRIDLLLFRRPDGWPLPPMVEALTAMITQGSVRHWGVSGFDVPDLIELTAVPGGTAVEADLIAYHLERRDAEWDLLPRCRRAGLAVLARSTVEPTGRPTLRRIAARHAMTPGQVALAWLLRSGVCALSGADDPTRVRNARAAIGIELTEAELCELDREFPPPGAAAGFHHPAAGKAGV